jgi:hypothetical protein
MLDELEETNLRHQLAPSCGHRIFMLLVFSVIFAFIWVVGVGGGITFSGYIHIFLILSVVLAIAHCWLPNRPHEIAQSCQDPLQQRRLSRLLSWRPRPKKP